METKFIKVLNERNSMNFPYILGLCLSDVTVWENKGELYFVLKTSKECMKNLFLNVFEEIADNIYFSESNSGRIRKKSIKVYARFKNSNKYYGILRKILDIKRGLVDIKECIKTEEDIFSLFLGMFDGDGSITLLRDKYVLIRITSTDLEKLKKVKRLFEKFGYELRITKDGKTGLTKKQKYSLRIPKKYQKLFVELISRKSLHKERKKKAEIILRMLNGDISFEIALEFVRNYGKTRKQG